MRVSVMVHKLSTITLMTLSDCFTCDSIIVKSQFMGLPTPNIIFMYSANFQYLKSHMKRDPIENSVNHLL